MARHRRRRALLAMVPLLAASCDLKAPRPPEPEAAPARGAATLAPNQRLREKALLGDTLAAEEITKHYKDSGETALSDKWGDLAAENGSLDQMIGYALRLGDAGGRENCIRAIYWLEKAQHEATVRGASEAYRQAIAKNIEHVKTRDHCRGDEARR